MTPAHPVAPTATAAAAPSPWLTAAASAVGLAVVSAGSPAVADTPPATFVGLVSGNALVQIPGGHPGDSSTPSS